MTDLAVGGLESAAPAPGEVRARFPCFDGFRAIAAMSVLITHVTFITRANRVPFGSYFARMDAGVAVFFVISGFLLFRPFSVALLDGAPGPALRPYAKRRLLRIFPAYWLAVYVITFVLGLHHPRSVGTFLAHVFLLHIYRPSLVLSGPVSQAWTLATEIAFYTFLPLLAVLLARRKGDERARLRTQVVTVVVLYLISVVYRIVVLRSGSPDEGMYLTWLPGYLDQFALGMGLAVASAWQHSRHVHVGWLESRWFPPASWLLAAGAFTMVALFSGLPTSTLDYSDASQMARQGLYGLTAFFLIAPGVFGPQDKGRIRGLLQWRPIALAGLVSYGVYLWHEVLINRFLAITNTREFSGQMLQMLLVVAAGALAVAAVSYVVVERPALELKDRRIRSLLHPSPTAPPWPRPRSRDRRTTLALLAITALAFVFRIVMIEHIADRNPDGGDPLYYHVQANLIADGEGFAEPFGYLESGRVVASAVHPPGFTLWLSIASGAGFDTFFSHKVMSAIAGSLVVLAIGLLTRRLAGPGAALLAAALAAMHPNLWVIEGILMPEALYALTIVIVLLVAYRYLATPTARWAAATGAVIALAALVRGEAIFLLPLLGLPLVLVRRRAWRERLVHIALIGVAAAVVLAPWTIRNVVAFHAFVPISVNSDEVIRNANCDATYYGSQLGFWSLDCYQPDPPPGYDEVERAAFWRRAGIDYIREHESRVPTVVAARIGRVWDLYKPGQNLDNSTLEGRIRDVSEVGQRAYYAMIPLAVAGLLVLRRRRVPVLPLAVMVLLVTLTAATAYGVIRFRVPAELAMIALSAVALDAVLRALHERRAR